MLAYYWLLLESRLDSGPLSDRMRKLLLRLNMPHLRFWFWYVLIRQRQHIMQQSMSCQVLPRFV
jgi:hypothetical protein